jgi:serine phosphatase RsbU (regulator of sigma subunit)
MYERERRIAFEMQAAALPATLPAVPGIALDADYRPGSDEARIGGDWYDAFVLDDELVAFTVGDVIGHGLHAAILMTKLRLAMQAAARVDPDPRIMLRVAEATMRLANSDGYATAFGAVYERRTRLLRFASAGHPRPLVRTGNGALTELAADGCLLGAPVDAPIVLASVVLEANASVVFFTDGLIEATRDLTDGFARLRKAIAREDVMADAHPASAIVTTVLDGNVPRDDIAVLVASFS